MSLLRNIRASLKNDGKTIVDEDIEEISKIYSDMNAAKIKAMRDAEKPFLEQLKLLEKKHGVILILKAE